MTSTTAFLRLLGYSFRPVAWRKAIGLAIVAAGGLILAREFWLYAASQPVVQNALIGGSVAALATALGTLPVVFSQRLSDRAQDTLFGFGAGVMLAACAFSLIILGFAAGAMLFVISHEIIPESHRKGHESWATGGLMLGFVLMMLLDTTLG